VASGERSTVLLPAVAVDGKSLRGARLDRVRLCWSDDVSILSLVA